MNWVDRVLVRLGDPATRAGLLDQEALRQIASAAYEMADLAPEGDYRADLADVALGVAAAPVASLAGGWSGSAGDPRTEAQLRVTGLGAADGPRVDALWTGAILVRAVLPGDPVERVETTSGENPIGVTVTFAPARAPAVQRTRLPVVSALLVRDAEDLSLADLLTETRVVRERLAARGLDPVLPSGLRPRSALLVTWVVPVTLFDDGDWPGAAADARRTAAGRWLAEQGIGLAVVP